MVNKDNIINKLSTFYFILFFVGFDFVSSISSIFIPNIAEVSQSVTIPYHAFSLSVALFVLLFNYRNKIEYNLGVLLLFIYLALFTIRFFYDFEIRTDVFVESERKMQLRMLYAQLLISTLAISKSYRNIDLYKSFKWIYFCYSIIILINYFTVPEFSPYSNDVEYQVSSGVRNTIGTGYLAAFYLLLSIFFLKSVDFHKIYKILSLPIMVCAIIILLRAGSRGPLLAVLVGLILLIALQKKNYIITLFIGAMLILGFLIFYSEVLDLISKISPIMTNRIQGTLEGGDTTRIGFFVEGIKGFLDQPFLGNQAMLYRQDGDPTVPHQVIIEAFMSTGIVGGVCIIVVIYLVIKNVISNLHIIVTNYWIELILLAYLTRALTAGSILVSDYPIYFAYFLLARNKESRIYWIT
jgi:O-antigen ligase